MYEFTVEDPNSLTGPWIALMPLRRTDGPLFEYARTGDVLSRRGRTVRIGASFAESTGDDPVRVVDYCAADDHGAVATCRVASDDSSPDDWNSGFVQPREAA